MLKGILHCPDFYIKYYIRYKNDAAHERRQSDYPAAGTGRASSHSAYSRQFPWQCRSVILSSDGLPGIS